MGNEVTGKLGQNEREPVRNVPPVPAGKRPERATGNPRTPAAPARRNSDPDGSSRGTGNTPAEEKKVPRLADVTPNPSPVAVPETPKKKQTRKPKKKKEEPQNFNAEQISALILSMSTIVSSKQGMEIWALRPEEATQLATPIANMIEKSEALKNMGEYADAISLVTASLVIFAPRAMMYHEMQKQKKIQQNGGVKLVRKENESGRSAEKPNRTDAAHGEKPSSSIFDAVPAILG